MGDELPEALDLRCPGCGAGPDVPCTVRGVLSPSWIRAGRDAMSVSGHRLIHLRRQDREVRACQRARLKRALAE